MKKSIFLITCLMIIAGCINAQDESKRVHVTAITDNQLSAKVAGMFTTLTNEPGKIVANCGISSFSIADFDFKTIFKSEKTGENEIAYSARYLYNEKGTEYAFTVYFSNGNFSNPMLVKSKSDRSGIIYFDLNENHVTEIQKIQGVFVANNRGIDLGSQVAGRNFGCGQCIANCISDAYTNHGWASVWAFVQSLFIPATGVAIAIGCAAKCCLK